MLQDFWSPPRSRALSVAVACLRTATPSAVCLRLCRLVTVCCSLRLGEGESRPLYLWQRQSSDCAVSGLCNLTWQKCRRMPRRINVHRTRLDSGVRSRTVRRWNDSSPVTLILMKMSKNNISSTLIAYEKQQIFPLNYEMWIKLHRWIVKESDAPLILILYNITTLKSETRHRLFGL